MHTTIINEAITCLKISKSKGEFLLSELVLILEASDVVVYSIQLIRSEADNIEAQVELERQELKHLLPTLRRYGYTILSEHQEDEWLEKIQSNASYLEKYLSI